jgi:alpha-methylacyl-CoA racemase
MTGPLTGLSVLELAGIGPGPFAGMVLADLGAQVVRVDRPGAPAYLGDHRLDLLGRGKRSVAIDLKQPRGAAAVLAMARRADALIEGFRPGVAERLGIGPADCHTVNPRLVYGRMTGWGQDGPLASAAGHDVTYLALTGVLHAIGPADGPPVPPVNLLGDYGGGGMLLVGGVLAALWYAERTGAGQVVDAAIVDGAALLATQLYGLLHSGLWEDRRGVNLLDGGAPFYGVYETADGEHVAVGPLEPQFYAEFAARLGLGDDAPGQLDRAGWPRLRELIAARLRTRTRDEWAAAFAGTDGCVVPVLSLREVAGHEGPRHPHLAERGVIVDPHGVPQPAPAPRFSASPTAPPALPPPLPGEHTRQVLTDWGVPEVDALIADGVAAEAR